MIDNTMPDNDSDPRDQIIIDKFLDICRINHYPEKTGVVVPGDLADSIYYVIEGSLSITMPGQDQRDYIISYLNAGDFIGEMGLFVPSHQREVLIKTRTPCRLAKVSYHTLRDALEHELKDDALEFLTLIGRKISLRLLKSNRKVLTLSSLDVEGRIARTLLDLCNEPGAEVTPDGIRVKLTREELSRFVGCSRELAGKTLKSFEERGILVSRGRTITIPDPELLR